MAVSQFGSGCVTAWLRHSLDASQFGFGCGFLLNLVSEQTTQNFAAGTFGNLLSELHPSSQPHVGWHVVCRKGEQSLDYTSASPPPRPTTPTTLPASSCVKDGSLFAGRVNNHHSIHQHHHHHHHHYQPSAVYRAARCLQER